MDTERIRQGLRSIKTRAATIDAVAGEGDAVLEAVLPLLQDRHEGVRWSAVRILSEIGDSRAVGALVTLLEQGRNAVDAAHALQAITGQEIGDSADEWKQWIAQSSDVRNATGSGVLSDDELMAAAVKELPVTVHGEGQEYGAIVSLPDGRSQQVWIDFSRTDPAGRAIVQLCTPCGDADPDRYAAALKLNMSIPFGAIALASLNDKLCFSMVDAYLRETVHPADVAESIMSLARQGDSLEQSLSSADQF